MNKKVIVGAILCVLVLLFVLCIVFPPVAKFDYIFGEKDYSVVLLILVILLGAYFTTLFDEKRISKVYLDSNGDLDVTTPREYTPLKVSIVSKLMGRANIYGQKNLSYFAYDDGRILVCNSKGDEIDAPLEEITYSYKMSKNGDEWYIYQFKISDANGNKLQFNRHFTMFTDEEWADIEMLLSLANDVKESKISKLTRRLDTAILFINELDFSNLTSSVIEQVNDIITSKISNKAGQIAKKRIYDKLSNKHKSLFNTLKEYFWWILIGIIGIVLIWINVENWAASSKNEKDSLEYNESMLDDNYTYEDDDIVGSEVYKRTESSNASDGNTNDDWIVDFDGTIGKYPIKMYLNLKNINNYDWCEVEGKYCYTSSGSGNYLYLSGVRQGESLELSEYNDKGEVSGIFKGQLEIYGNLAWFEYSGTFTNYAGKTFNFSLRGN